MKIVKNNKYLIYSTQKIYKNVVGSRHHSNSRTKPSIYNFHMKIVTCLAQLSLRPLEVVQQVILDQMKTLNANEASYYFNAHIAV